MLLIKIFFVVGSVWLYVIHPTYVPAIPKIGPTPLIERAASFTFPQKIEFDPEADAVARISGEHRELSLREVSSVGAAVVKSKAASTSEPSTSEVESK